MLPTIAAISLWLNSQAPFHLDKELPEYRSPRMDNISQGVHIGVSKATCINIQEPCTPIWKGSPEELTAAVLLTGREESHYALNVHEGRCRVNIGECDPVRVKTPLYETREVLAAGSFTPWQIKPSRSFPMGLMTMAVGSGLLPTTHAATEATRRLVRSYNLCSSRGTPGWGHAFSHYGTGSTCENSKLINRSKDMQKIINYLVKNSTYVSG